MKRGKGKTKGLRPSIDPAYGEAPRPLAEDKLPLYRDVGLAVEYYKVVEGLDVNEAENKAIDNIENIYEKASIPTIAKPLIRKKVQKIVKLRAERMKNVAIDKRTG